MKKGLIVQIVCLSVTGFVVLVNVIASLFALSLPNIDMDALIEKLKDQGGEVAETIGINEKTLAAGINLLKNLWAVVDIIMIPINILLYFIRCFCCKDTGDGPSTSRSMSVSKNASKSATDGIRRLVYMDNA
ncbi:MAG: hypothetical protein EZS28_055522 [Streblomastix strix]|uniref:Uncharacterized protein n=1 Tax=Streblomastix strix TaxID=222440 RepID=A0A5J4Q197_9EUKA|nr:MAG: hypothetical protein EZS28_055522 [Streblomastix strix]